MTSMGEEDCFVFGTQLALESTGGDSIWFSPITATIPTSPSSGEEWPEALTPLAGKKVILTHNRFLELRVPEVSPTDLRIARHSMNCPEFVSFVSDECMRVGWDIGMVRFISVLDSTMVGKPLRDIPSLEMMTVIEKDLPVTMSPRKVEALGRHIHNVIRHQVKGTTAWGFHRDGNPAQISKKMAIPAYTKWFDQKDELFCATDDGGFKYLKDVPSICVFVADSSEIPRCEDLMNDVIDALSDASDLELDPIKIDVDDEINGETIAFCDFCHMGKHNFEEFDLSTHRLVSLTGYDFVSNPLSDDEIFELARLQHLAFLGCQMLPSTLSTILKQSTGMVYFSGGDEEFYTETRALSGDSSDHFIGGSLQGTVNLKNYLIERTYQQLVSRSPLHELTE